MRNNSSFIWNYFDRSDDALDKRARCKQCSNVFSYRSTITNLKLHLMKKHESSYKEHSRLDTKNKASKTDQRDTANDDDSNTSAEQQLDQSEEAQVDVKDVRTVFEVQTGGRGRCTLCLASVSYQDSEMKRHLKSRHPIKFAQIYGDTTSNASDAQELFKDVIYLEDQYHSPPHPSTSKRNPRRATVRRFSTKRQLSPTPEPIVKKTPKISHQDEEIEKFTVYIKHLLKTLSPEVCSRLQMEIINLIMSEKLKKPESELSTTPILIQQLVPKDIESLTGRLENGGETSSQASNQDSNQYVIRIENDIESKE